MINMNNLYPVVHDLTDVEAEEQANSCLLDTGCFSLQDLVNPQFSPIHYWSSNKTVDQQTPTNNTKEPQRKGFFGKQGAYQMPYPISLVVDDRNDSVAKNDERTMKFDDVYVLTREVHKGKITTLWECVHRTTGVRYAAKVADRRHLSTRDDQSIWQEHVMLKDVSWARSGISKLVDFFEEQTHFYIVMEFFSGGDILTMLVKKGKLPEEDCKLFTRSLLRGLNYLHTNGICHRNLKPENLLLRDSNDMSSVVIADFGMAKRIKSNADGDLLFLTERCGSSSYMAPEVVQQNPYGTQADMWGVGVLVFYALTGNLPFGELSRRAVFQKIVKCEYSFHPSDWLGISKASKRFISNLLVADPEVRLDADEALNHSWLADIDSRLIGLPEIMAPPKTRTEKPSKKRNAPTRSNSMLGKKFLGLCTCNPVSRKRRPGDMDDNKSINSLMF
mmetsp:Transcript_19661/g.29174  ORF Transcript_19661/g.29174 Transcript_19661/m.29174 type:complete len:446 (-) Transcript_19661:295-1632(-)